MKLNAIKRRNRKELGRARGSTVGIFVDKAVSSSVALFINSLFLELKVTSTVKI